MRIVSGAVIAAAFLTACAVVPGVQLLGGSTPQCADRLGPSCPDGMCISVRVTDENGAPLRNVRVAAWLPDETFEHGTPPEALLIQRTGLDGHALLYVNHAAEVPRDGVRITADGRKGGRAFVVSEGSIRAFPECIDFVLPRTSGE